MKTVQPLLHAGAAVLILAVVGCAHDVPVWRWVPTRADVLPLAQAQDRCEYESSAATQLPDYGVAAFMRDVDRRDRRANLMVLCMRAQGYEARRASEGIGLQTPQRWAELEKGWEDAREERARMRALLSANPTGPNAAQQSERIRQLNETVRSLERQLSYSPTTPVSPDP